jgi:ankyrin repeat protein
MLAAGLPAAGVFSQHHGSPLHWAAWHGNAELVRLILRYRPPLEDADNEFSSTPLGWAVHGSENGWERHKGDYAATVEALLTAGARPPQELGGVRAVQDVLRRHGVG